MEKEKFDTIEKESLLDWLIENYAKFGSELQMVSDKSNEGSQFCNGFGGIGAILRYKCESNTEIVEAENEYEYFSDFTDYI